MRDTLIDREDETNKILNEIKTAEQSFVKILSSPTGVGKSALVLKLIEKIENLSLDIICIRVETKPINQASNLENGYYLKEIFNKLCSLFENDFDDSNNITEKMRKKLCFSNYIANCKNDFHRKKILEKIIKNIDFTQNNFKNMIMESLIKLGIYKFLKLEDFNKDVILDNIEDSHIIKDYITYCLSTCNFLLNIDNVQNIDEVSEKYLLDCIYSTKNTKNIFIFEYTSVNNDFRWLISFQDNIRKLGISAEVVKVKNLKLPYAIEIAKNCVEDNSNSEKFKKQVEIYYLSKDNGNLFDLKNFSYIYDEKNFQTVDNASLLSLVKLNDKEKFIIAILVLHNGKIKKELLIQILKKTDTFLIIDVEKYLIDFNINSELIKLEEDIIQISHASILDTWKENKKTFGPIYYSAYDYCIKFYQEIYKDSNYLLITKPECILFMINTYTEFDAQELVGILDDIEDISINYMSLKDIEKCLKKILDCIEPEITKFEKIYFKILQIYIQSDLLDEAQYCISIAKNKNFRLMQIYFLYSCIVMILRENYNEALNLIADCVGIYGSEVDKYLYLLKIVILRSINNTKELNLLLSEINEKNMFKSDYTNGFYLRLAEAYDTRENAIIKVEESIRYFEDYYNDPIQAAKSKLSFSFLLAINGKTDKAKNVIADVEKILAKSRRNICIFKVNNAALMLLDNNFSEAILDLLDSAELYTNSIFNKTAIYINKLVYYIENRNQEKGSYCITKLLSCLNLEKDKHMHAISYYNIYVFYRDICSNNDKADRFYKLAEEKKEYCNALKLRFKPEINSNKYDFLLSKKWHVCFLSYWDIDIDKLLDYYEY